MDQKDKQSLSELPLSIEHVQLARSDNSRLLLELAIDLQTSKLNGLDAIQVLPDIIDKLYQLDTLPFMDVIAIEGIKGSGKSTLTTGLTAHGVGERTHLVQSSPLRELLIKPRQTGIYMEMYGSSGLPEDSITDTLIKSALIFDNLQIGVENNNRRIFDRFWLSHLSIESALMRDRGVSQDHIQQIMNPILGAYPQISSMIVLTGVDSAQCEVRMVEQRGEQPRSARAFSIDSQFGDSITALQRGLIVPPTDLYPIHYLNVNRDTPDILTEALGLVKNLL